MEKNYHKSTCRK